MNSLTNWFEFINKLIWIQQQIDLNSLTITWKFINEFIWIHLQIQLNSSTDSNFLKILLIFIIWIFWGNHQWIKKWIHWIKSKTEKFFNSFFFAFSMFLVILLNFFKIHWLKSNYLLLQTNEETNGDRASRVFQSSRSRDWNIFVERAHQVNPSA